jgi:hypothetical protein
VTGSPNCLYTAGVYCRCKSYHIRKEYCGTERSYYNLKLQSKKHILNWYYHILLKCRPLEREGKEKSK